MGSRAPDKSARCARSPSPSCSPVPCSPGACCRGSGACAGRAAVLEPARRAGGELTDESPPGNTVMLAANGEVITHFYKENRAPVASDQIAEIMKQALVAIEDARFYDHGGLDVQGTLRAGHQHRGGRGARGRLHAHPAAGQADPPAGGARGQRGGADGGHRRPWAASCARSGWRWRWRTRTARTSCSPGTSTSSTSGRTPTGSSPPPAPSSASTRRADAAPGRPAGRAGAQPGRRRPVHQPRGRHHPAQPGALPDGRAGYITPAQEAEASGRPARPRARPAAAPRVRPGQRRGLRLRLRPEVRDAEARDHQQELEQDGLVIQTTLDAELQRAGDAAVLEHAASGDSRPRRSPPCSRAPGTCWR